MTTLLRATRLAPVLRTCALQKPSAYVLGERSMTNFKDKERGEETVHFRKADEDLLRKLLQKVHTLYLLCNPFSQQCRLSAALSETHSAP